MKVLKGSKLFTASIALVALSNLSSTASGTPRFFVECHSAGSVNGEVSQDYFYHMRAYGSPEKVENGIDINLDEEKMVLSVESRQTGEEKYSQLYPDMPLAIAKEQPCANGNCSSIDYEPKEFEGKLIVTYDKDKGAMLVKHAIAPETSVQARGGCLFVALPSRE